MWSRFVVVRERGILASTTTVADLPPRDMRKLIAATPEVYTSSFCAIFPWYAGVSVGGGCVLCRSHLCCAMGRLDGASGLAPENLRMAWV